MYNARTIQDHHVVSSSIVLYTAGVFAPSDFRWTSLGKVSSCFKFAQTHNKYIVIAFIYWWLWYYFDVLLMFHWVLSLFLWCVLYSPVLAGGGVYFCSTHGLYLTSWISTSVHCFRGIFKPSAFDFKFFDLHLNQCQVKFTPLSLFLS